VVDAVEEEKFDDEVFGRTDGVIWMLEDFDSDTGGEGEWERR